MCGNCNRTTAAANRAGAVHGPAPAHRTLFVLHSVSAAGWLHLIFYATTEAKQPKTSWAQGGTKAPWGRDSSVGGGCTSLKGVGRERWICPVVSFLYAEDISLTIVCGFRKQGGWAFASAPQPGDVCFVFSECTQPGALCPDAPTKWGQCLEQCRWGEGLTSVEDTQAALDGIVQGNNT